MTARGDGSSSQASRATRSETSLARALTLVACVWLLLALTGWLGASRPGSMTLLIGFAAATLLVLAARRGPRRRHPKGALLAALPMGAGAGFAGMAAVMMLVFWVQGEPAWDLIGLFAEKGLLDTNELAFGISLAVLGPVFEEVLYREHLLGAIRAEFGAWAGALGSSALYAATHGQALGVAGAFAFGLILAFVMLRTGSLLLCVALHSGANVAWLGGHWVAGWLGASPVVAGLLAAAAAAVGIAGAVRLLEPREPDREVALHQRAGARG